MEENGKILFDFLFVFIRLIILFFWILHSVEERY